MLSATFFGHRDFDYSPYRDRVRAIITDLVEAHGAMEFLNGFRGNFDRLCAEEVFLLKTRCLYIKNVLVLSYHDRQKELPQYFDESVYLLEKRVPPQYAISHTNQAMILKADFIVSGVRSPTAGRMRRASSPSKRKKSFSIFSKMSKKGARTLVSAEKILKFAEKRLTSGGKSAKMIKSKQKRTFSPHGISSTGR